MSTCNTHIEPVFQEDPCNGERLSTDCVIHSPAIPPLSLPENSSVSNIISNIVLALNNQNNLITNLTQRITELESQEFNNCITALCVEQMLVFDNEIEASSLANYTPYKTSTGELKYKLPVSEPSANWVDTQTWDDTTTWID